MQALADIFTTVVDDRAPTAFRAYDGSVAGPQDTVAVVEIRSPLALRYVLSAPGELGLARAYVTGALDVRGDLHAALRGLVLHVRRPVSPDGELQGPGTVIGAMHDHGLEVRHAENLREHYAITLAHWAANLEKSWGKAVAEIGERRARAWRLYMAASRLGFELGRVQVHQVLGVRTTAAGRSGIPLRSAWEHRLPSSDTTPTNGRVDPSVSTGVIHAWAHAKEKEQ